ncbi:potassium/proton antiporter [Nocardioides campestrisoli]|uniref:potassium/proton antiporter n=1 Tax=Nocardioides campestrisoli TaxID=2736757 RepID=UPI0015E7B433|nr:potassium/proton antiporter [Nocardioides campestrisoli]
MDLNLVIGGAALVLLTGVAAVRVSARAGLPSLLLYLVIGLAIGEAGLGLQFEDLELTMVLSTLALAVILAEGGFSTRWDVIRPVVGLAGMLATVGVAASVAVTALIAYVALDVDPRTALLLGAVVGSTDAAATFSIMRRLPVRPRLRATLEAESGFNDPPVIILVTVVASDAWYEAQGLEIAALVVFQLVVGLVTGLVVAMCGQWLLSRSALPAAGLYPLATFAILFLAFSTAGVLGGSGLMAIYVAGMWLGNARLPHHQATAGFADGMGWLAQIGLFVLLGLLASPNRLADAVLPALIVGVGLTFVARPLSVALCSVWWRVPWRHQVFLSWAGLRGAVPIVLATIPITQGLPEAEQIFDVVFLLVTTFVLIQAPSLPWLARRTGVVVERAHEIEVESAPLESIDASLLQFEVPPGSRLAGVFADDLRLPSGAVLALVGREGKVSVPDRHTSLRPGDQLLLVVPERVRNQTERRLQAISRQGRLAVWLDEEPGAGPPQEPPEGRQPGRRNNGRHDDVRAGRALATGRRPLSRGRRPRRPRSLP